MKRKEFVYRLYLRATNKEAMFASISAIYQDYSKEELGISLRDLYEQTISPLRPFSNEFCTITKHPLHRKAQRNPSTPPQR